MPAISVILPVFNGELVLERSIESVLKQSFIDFELIVIDDGSTDNSIDIIMKYAHLDNRIVFASQSNRGVSASRNYGLTLSNGQFLAFIDADDWMESNMLEVMYNSMIQEKSEFVICNIRVWEEKVNPYKRLDLSSQNLNLLDMREFFLKSLLRFKFDNANWNKLYLNSIVKKNNLIFNVRMNLWEDLLFNIQYSSWIKSVTLVDLPLYNYSIAGSGLSTSCALNRIKNLNFIYAETDKFFCSNQDLINGKLVKDEICRIVIFELVSDLECDVLKTSENPLKRIRLFQNYLARIDCRIFNYRNLLISPRLQFIVFLLSKKFYLYYIVKFALTRAFVNTFSR
jgi:glycosyltransferase involved in cell wall biosynthesis